MEMSGLSEEQVDGIVNAAEQMAEEAEEAAAEERRVRKEREQVQKEEANEAPNRTKDLRTKPLLSRM